jgi:DNA-binding response OmpR family regulator
MHDRPRLLIVEDDEPLRTLLAEVAEAHGCEVSCVDYAAAVGIIESDPPNMVVTELLVRGGGNGTDLATLARTMGIATLILAVGVEPLRKLQSAGFSVLGKPFRIEEFEGKLEELCQALRA